MVNLLSEDIVVACTTLYGPSKLDRVKADIAIESIRRAVLLGYQVVIFDGGSNWKFYQRAFEAGARVKFDRTKTSFGSSKREAVKMAFDTSRSYIVLTEAEKLGLVDSVERLVLPLTKSVDLVLPKRFRMDSYPTLQAQVETLGNSYLGKLTGREDLDFWFGPRVFGKHNAGYFLDPCAGEKWDAIFKPVMKMIHERKNVVSFEINYEHPRQQTEFEEIDLKGFKKRLLQLENLTTPLEAYWRNLKYLSGE